MKKNPCLCLLLALVLMFGLMCPPVFAAEVDGSAPQTGESTEETQPVEESGEASEPLAESEDGSQVIVESGEGETAESSEPEVIYTIPQSVTGDASVVAGCHTIDGASALIPQEELELDLKAALMYEMNSGTLLYTMNPDEKMYPASVTKVMTCLVAMEKGNLEDVLTVSREVVYSRDPAGSNVDLKVEEKMTLKELLYCLMVASANDAASTISEYIAGSEEAFVELMNEKAAELGCTNTHFANPHGLHDENHYTCARDLAKIMMAALEYDIFNEIYSTKTYEVPATNKSEARQLVSTNYMIEQSQVEHYYDKRVIGGKTGFTTPAGRCFVGVSESGEMKVLTVALGGSTGNNQYGALVYGSFEGTGDMIDYAFGRLAVGQVLTPEAIMKSIPVEGGENDTQAVVMESVDAVIPQDVPASQLEYEYVLDSDTLTAPVEAGAPVGYVRVWYQSKCLAQKELYTSIASPVKTVLRVSDPALSNPEAAEQTDLVQLILTVIVVILVLIVILLGIGYVRTSIRRAKRRKRRAEQRRNNRRSR